MSDGPLRPVVLHLTGDYPDPFDRAKTPAIRSFISLTRDRFDHLVVSINRQAPSLGSAIRPALPDLRAFDEGLALIYRAPGKGVMHRRHLIALGDWLADYIAASARRPQLLVGHKLTIEGIATARAARLLGLPYAITLQGNTDTRILTMRPDLRPALAEVYHGAAHVFSLAPWAHAAVERLLGKRDDGASMLPCATQMDTPLRPRAGGDGLVSVFHLRQHRLKNVAGLTAAQRLLERQGKACRLAIVGGGDAVDMRAVRGALAKSQSIRLEGHIDQSDLPGRLNRAKGFVLPSHRESFGQVFIEALFAGLPIAYPAGAAVDGYLDDQPFAIRVDARKPASVAKAMQDLVVHEAELKKTLADWLESDAPYRFTRPAIASAFAAGLQSALAQGGVEQAA